MKRERVSWWRDRLGSDRGLLAATAIAIPVLVAIAYGASVRNSFVWDDETLVVDNPCVHDLSRWPQYFTVAESASKERIARHIYRPVQTLSFAVDSALFGERAGGFHLTSLLLHVGACFAIMFAFTPLLGARAAVTGAAAFAIHPALAEGVLSVASRGNQLYTVLALLALGVFLRARNPFDRHHLISVLLATIALFSKEPAIALVALFPLVQWFASRPPARSLIDWVRWHAPLALVALGYLGARAAVVEAWRGFPYWGGSLGATLLMQAKVFAIDLRLLVWPFTLKGRYTIDPPQPFPDPLVIGAIVLLAALGGLAFVAHRRGNTGRNLSLAIAWFFVSLLPVANLIPIPGSMMGERFLYFTFAGMLPLLGAAIAPALAGRGRPAVLLACGVVGVAWLVRDITRVPVWRDNASFFAVLAGQEPSNPVVQIRMAQVELAEGDVPSALARLERVQRAPVSSATPPDQATLHFWYGKALLDAGHPARAVAELQRAVELNPAGRHDAALPLAEAAARTADLATARRVLEQELAAAPSNDAAWNGLGNVLLMSGDRAGATVAYRRALAINSSNHEAAANLQRAAP